MEKQDLARERLAKLDSVLDEYESSIGLPKFTDNFHDDSAKKYLQLTRDQIEKLTPDQCSEAALLLSGLAFHLQRSYNREIARINWADKILKSKFTCISYSETDFLSFYNVLQPKMIKA